MIKDSLSKEEIAEIVEEYMQDPFNQMNAMVSSAVSMSTNVLGPIDTLDILANYTGMILGSLITGTSSREEAQEVIDSFSERMGDLVDQYYGEDFTLAPSSKDDDKN